MTTAKLFDLDGHTALITGGGTGLGRHFATILAQAGATVIVCGRRMDKLRETAAAIEVSGGKSLCIAMDVTDRSSVRSAFDQAVPHGPVTILVNNAGTAGKSSLLDTTESEWDAIQDTNCKGAWLVATEAARRLIERRVAGSIINIASLLGVAVQKGTGPYCVSKAGLLHLTRAMALEWARYDIRVNAIAPGYVATDIAREFLDSDAGRAMIRRIPQRRLCTPADLHGAILLLASDASAHMTGSVTIIDGGHSLASI